MCENTPGTAGGPGGRDRTLALKSRKTHMGDSQKQKTEKKKEEEEERLNDGDNNGQATHGAHKHAWRTPAAWAKTPWGEMGEEHTCEWGDERTVAV